MRWGDGGMMFHEGRSSLLYGTARGIQHKKNQVVNRLVPKQMDLGLP